jgi:hypothetical protein
VEGEPPSHAPYFVHRALQAQQHCFNASTLSTWGLREEGGGERGGGEGAGKDGAGGDGRGEEGVLRQGGGGEGGQRRCLPKAIPVYNGDAWREGERELKAAASSLLLSDLPAGIERVLVLECFLSIECVLFLERVLSIECVLTRICSLNRMCCPYKNVGCFCLTCPQHPCR